MRSFKWIGKIACLCVLLATLAISASAAENTTQFAGGEGTEESPYLIANATHLNNVRNYTDAHYKMTADIVFVAADFAEEGTFYNDGVGWEPIGKANMGFSGTFDGNGHIITGLKQDISSDTMACGGLFGYVGRATIKNLGMIDANISVVSMSSSVRAGSIAGNINNSVISNCHNDSVVAASNETLPAVSASSYTGGIVGHATDSSIINCYNMGALTTSSSRGDSYVGGIVGYANSGNITNCYNAGGATSAPSTFGSYAYAGGIAGKAYSDTIISNCYNTGAVTATKLTSYSRAAAGGIVGYTSYGGTISNCYNMGAVTGVSSDASVYAGGIAGYTYYGTISNCYNTGLVFATNSSSGSANAGGIVGYTEKGSLITNCYNMSAVTSKEYVGGIAGSVSASTVSNCYNTGAITTTSGAYGGEAAGGVVGYAGSGGIRNCYNTGAVASDVYAGGIAGYADTTNAIINGYNVGKVTSKEYAGGIAGYVYSGLTVSNSYYLNTNNNGVGSGVDTATKCTEEQMLQQATFVDFDFTDVWSMAGNTEYPYPELVGVPMIFTKESASIGISSVSATSATLTIANNEAGKCYVAVYTTGGQMLSYGLTSVTADAGEVTISITPFTTTSPYTVKAFLVDSQGIPVCQCAES